MRRSTVEKLESEPRFSEARNELEGFLWRFDELGHIKLDELTVQMALWMLLRKACGDGDLIRCWWADTGALEFERPEFEEFIEFADECAGKNLAQALTYAYQILDEAEGIEEEDSHVSG